MACPTEGDGLSREQGWPVTVYTYSREINNMLFVYLFIFKKFSYLNLMAACKLWR
ncbi:MAG: hypothetical protein WCA84_03605 [Ignavibacteriaceae bacterium]|jgi:hypothetical protein